MQEGALVIPSSLMLRVLSHSGQTFLEYIFFFFFSPRVRVFETEEHRSLKINHTSRGLKDLQTILVILPGQLNLFFFLNV